MTHLLQIHARVVTSGLSHDSYLASELLRFCALSPSGSLLYSDAFLRRSPEPAISLVASWNHVIRGHATRGSPEAALRTYLLMRRGRNNSSSTLPRPSRLTYPFVLKACASVSAAARDADEDRRVPFGNQVHGEIFKSGCDSNVYVCNTLITFYGSCREVGDARRVFDETSDETRTVVSWNSMLTVYVENSQPEESIDLFLSMRRRFRPEEATMVVLLSAAAELGNLSLGKWVHSQMVIYGLGHQKEATSGKTSSNYSLLRRETALVNMYAKCGLLYSAIEVFDRMSDRNVWTWSAMILGYAQHGEASRALELFTQMKESRVEPNDVTFLGVLCACGHAGLVEEGRRFFIEMKDVHGIQPRMSHYSTMVDILGRNSRLEEAYAFIEGMPIEADPVVWRTLLSACHLHRNSKNCLCGVDRVNDDARAVGEKVRLKLLAMEPRRCGNYVMVANMFAEEGSYEDAAHMWRLVKEVGLKKTAGESYIELNGTVHRFVSGYNSRVSFKNEYAVVRSLNFNLRNIGGCLVEDAMGAKEDMLVWR